MADRRIVFLLTSFTRRIAGGCTRTRRRFFTVIGMVLAAAQVVAAPQVTVDENDGVYTVAAIFSVPQSPAATLAVLTDYEHLTRFMPGLRKSVVLDRRTHGATIEQDATARFLAFSKSIHLVLDVEEDDHSLRFKDTSAKSFSRYEGSWLVSTQDGQTLVTYNLVAKPSFSVPEFLLGHLLKRDAGNMIDALQKEIAVRAK